MKTEQEWADIAVQAGISFLDDQGPSDWRSRIDLDRLDIFSCTNCIAGQVWADKVSEYDSGYHYLVDGLIADLGLRDEFRSVEYGFCAGGVERRNHDSWVSSYVMTEAWKRALQSV